MTRQPKPGTRLVEEIVLLTQAVAEHAGPWLDQVAAPPPEDHENTENTEDWAPPPLGPLLALLRGQPNEQAARYLNRTADLVALLRAVLADRWEPEVIHMPGFRPRDNSAARPAGSPRVQRIPLRPGFGASDT